MLILHDFFYFFLLQCIMLHCLPRFIYRFVRVCVCMSACVCRGVHLRQTRNISMRLFVCLLARHASFHPCVYVCMFFLVYECMPACVAVYMCHRAGTPACGHTRLLELHLCLCVRLNITSLAPPPQP